MFPATNIRQRVRQPYGACGRTDAGLKRQAHMARLKLHTVNYNRALVSARSNPARPPKDLQAQCHIGAHVLSMISMDAAFETES